MNIASSRIEYLSSHPLTALVILFIKRALAARGMEEHIMLITLIFARIIGFVLFTLFLLLMYFVSKNF